MLEYDLSGKLESFSVNDLDLKGEPKIIYYESGINFYKNMIEASISVVIILLINVVVWILLRIIPLGVSQRLAEKIRMKWLINLSEIVESLVIPFVFFGVSQVLFILLYDVLWWVYVLCCCFLFVLLLFPFMMLIYSSKIRKNANVATT